MSLVELADIRKRFGAVEVLKGISLTLEKGEIVATLGDMTGLSHPMVTSMREHKGYLFVGGILNNRIGRYKLDSADPHWTGPSSYWGAQS